jgi:predicted RNA-binding protein with PUA-like domain
MREGDRVLFYHSSCDVVGIAGIARVVWLPHADETQFELGWDYYEPRATREKPVWICVDVEFVEKFDRVITISELRSTPGLETMKILEKGNRLSITPLTEKEWGIIESLVQS